MIASASKQRHELADGRIRALYGHSIPGKLRKERTAPPAVLFHGTAPASLPIIGREGLLPMRRQYVHLSVERDGAVAVGRRKAPAPAILLIKAQKAWEAGVSFYAGNEKVWLADCVPPAFIEFENA